MIKIKKRILIFLIILSVIISGCTIAKTGFGGTGYPPPPPPPRSITQIGPNTWRADVLTTPHPENSYYKFECFPNTHSFGYASKGGKEVPHGCAGCPNAKCIRWIAMKDPQFSAITGLSTEDTEVSYKVSGASEPTLTGRDITVEGCGNGVCDGDEDCNSCPVDCTTTTCGDGLCCFNENCKNCPSECTTTTCGDGLCCFNENCNNCLGDCPRIPVGTDDYICSGK